MQELGVETNDNASSLYSFMMVKFGMAEGQDGMIFRRTPMEIANVKLQLLAQILNIMEARKQVAWNMMGLRLALISKHFIKSNHLQDAH